MKRQMIVDIIVDQMKKIQHENSFYSDAGKNVFEWLEKPLDKDEYPAIIIRDVSDDTQDGQVLNHSLKIEVDIAVSSKATTVWDMREVSSDVLKTFGVIEDTINYQCAYLGSEFLLEQKDTVYGGVRLTFSVAYQTSRWEQ
jgi:hypothetical protein